MARQDDEEPAGPTGRFADDLLGLDPDDPEVQEFVAHRDRMESPNSKATVEGMLHGVGDFAQSANRTEGHRRVVTVLVVLLILIGLVFAAWNTLSSIQFTRPTGSLDGTPQLDPGNLVPSPRTGDRGSSPELDSY